MLRAYLFAPAAADAVGRLAAPLRMCRVPPAAVPVRIALVRVEIGKQIGNGDALGAAFHTVTARRAGDGIERAEHPAHLFDRRHLRRGERKHVLHEGEVVVHLRHIAHAGEHHAHLREMRGKAQGIARITAAVQPVQHGLCAVGQIDEDAALDRLHDDDGLIVLHAYVVAGAALDGVVVVIGVVELDLHDFDLGIEREDLVEHVGSIVEGEPDVPDLPLLFQLERRFVGAAAAELPEVLRVLRMHEIKIEILHPAPCELFFKEGADIRLALEIGIGELIREYETLARVALYEALADRRFALSGKISVRRIEIVEPLLEKGVRHFAELRRVHLVAEHGKAHAAEPEPLLYFGKKPIFHTVLHTISSLLSYHIFTAL